MPCHAPAARFVIAATALTVICNQTTGQLDCTGTTGTQGDLCLSGGLGGPGDLGEGGIGGIGSGAETYAWPSCGSSPRTTIQCHPDSAGWFANTVSNPHFVGYKACCDDNKSLYEIEAYTNNVFQGSFWSCMTQAGCDAL